MTLNLEWLLVPHGLVLSISKSADLLGFSCTTISRVYREWFEKEKVSSERQFCGRKCLVDGNSKKATVIQITTRYIQGMQNTISEFPNTLNAEADGVQQQKTTVGAAPVSYGQETEATIRTGSPKLDNGRLEKRCLV